MPDKPAAMMRKDLEAAGFPCRDASDRVADFHALRHTFITRLARSGVAPAVAKSLARHSTIMLTMDHYTHTLIEDERSALDRLPALAPDGQEREVARATGTYDASPDRQLPPPARSALSARRRPGTSKPAASRQDRRSRKEKGEGAQVVVTRGALCTVRPHPPARQTQTVARHPAPRRMAPGEGHRQIGLRSGQCDRPVDSFPPTPSSHPGRRGHRSVS